MPRGGRAEFSRALRGDAMSERLPRYTLHDGFRMPMGSP